jgi:hypothetical protein
LAATALSQSISQAIDSKRTLELSYILPIKSQTLEGIGEVSGYLEWLASQVDEVIVVDGSASSVFLTHEAMWAGLGVRHVAPDERHATANGKVAGVLTGLYAAKHERLVIADDDVRYGREALEMMVQRLDGAHVVRPQNYFEPLTWHARWDTARSLLNRATDGDWPGTLAVRRSALLATQGYDGDCLFENLELVRTVMATGGTETLARDVYVRRLPPRTSHFMSQRVRQAYDEFARPGRLAAQLCLLPAMLLLARRPWGLPAAGLAAIACAEYGRRRDGGAEVFPATSSWFAPLWLAERAICSWLAVGKRVREGGVVYNGRVIRRAASTQAELNKRYEGAR